MLTDGSTFSRAFEAKERRYVQALDHLSHKYSEYLENSDSFVSLLKGHLFLETLIGETLWYEFPNPDGLGIDRIDFARKLKMFIAFAYISDDEGKPYFALNTVRVKLAHNFDGEVLGKDILLIVSALSKSQEEFFKEWLKNATDVKLKDFFRWLALDDKEPDLKEHLNFILLMLGEFLRHRILERVNKKLADINLHFAMMTCLVYHGLYGFTTDEEFTAEWLAKESDVASILTEKGDGG